MSKKGQVLVVIGSSGVIGRAREAPDPAGARQGRTRAGSGHRHSKPNSGSGHGSSPPKKQHMTSNKRLDLVRAAWGTVLLTAPDIFVGSTRTRWKATAARRTIQ